MKTSFVVFTRDSAPYMVVETGTGGTRFKPMNDAAKNLAKAFAEEYASSEISKAELSAALDAGMQVDGPMPPSAVAAKLKTRRKPADEKMLPVIPVSDVPIGHFSDAEFKNIVAYKASAFTVDRYKTTFNYEVKRVRAVWDPSLSIPGTSRRGGWRCPTGTRFGGQITDRFGRNCGWGLARRIANQITNIGERLESIDDRRRGRRVDRRNRRMLERLQRDREPGRVERGLRGVAERLEGDDAPSSAPATGRIERGLRGIADRLEGGEGDGRTTTAPESVTPPAAPKPPTPTPTPTPSPKPKPKPKRPKGEGTRRRPRTEAVPEAGPAAPARPRKPRTPTPKPARVPTPVPSETPAAAESMPDSRSFRNIRNRFGTDGMPDVAYWRAPDYDGDDKAELERRFGRYYSRRTNRINARGRAAREEVRGGAGQPRGGRGGRGGRGRRGGRGEAGGAGDGDARRPTPNPLLGEADAAAPEAAAENLPDNAETTQLVDRFISGNRDRMIGGLQSEFRAGGLEDAIMYRRGSDRSLQDQFRRRHGGTNDANASSALRDLNGLLGLQAARRERADNKRRELDDFIRDNNINADNIDNLPPDQASALRQLIAEYTEEEALARFTEAEAEFLQARRAAAVARNADARAQNVPDLGSRWRYRPSENVYERAGYRLELVRDENGNVVLGRLQSPRGERFEQGFAAEQNDSMYRAFADGMFAVAGGDDSPTARTDSNDVRNARVLREGQRAEVPDEDFVAVAPPEFSSQQRDRVLDAQVELAEFEGVAVENGNVSEGGAIRNFDEKVDRQFRNMYNMSRDDHRDAIEERARGEADADLLANMNRGRERLERLLADEAVAAVMLRSAIERNVDNFEIQNLAAEFANRRAIREFSEISLRARINEVNRRRRAERGLDAAAPDVPAPPARRTAASAQQASRAATRRPTAADVPDGGPQPQQPQRTVERVIAGAPERAPNAPERNENIAQDVEREVRLGLPMDDPQIAGPRNERWQQTLERVLGYRGRELAKRVAQGAQRAVERDGDRRYKSKYRELEALNDADFDTAERRHMAELVRIRNRIADKRLALKRRVDAYAGAQNQQRAADDIARIEADIRLLGRDLALALVENEAFQAIRAARQERIQAERNAAAQVPLEGFPNLEPALVGLVEDEIRRGVKSQQRRVARYLVDRHGAGDLPWTGMTPQRWNAMSNAEKRAYLKELYSHPIIRGENGKFYSVEVTAVNGQGNEFTVSGKISEVDANGRVIRRGVGDFARNVRPNIGEVYNASFFIRDARDKRNGVATILNNYAWMGLQAIGVREARVTAVDDGPYVWAKMGYNRGDIGAEKRTVLLGEIEAFRAGRGSIIKTEQQARLLEALLNAQEVDRRNQVVRPRQLTHQEMIFALLYGMTPDEKKEREAAVRTWVVRNVPFNGGVLDFAKNMIVPDARAVFLQESKVPEPNVPSARQADAPSPAALPDAAAAGGRTLQGDPIEARPMPLVADFDRDGNVARAIEVVGADDWEREVNERIAQSIQERPNLAIEQVRRDVRDYDDGMLAGGYRRLRQDVADLRRAEALAAKKYMDEYGNDPAADQANLEDFLRQSYQRVHWERMALAHLDEIERRNAARLGGNAPRRTRTPAQAGRPRGPEAGRSNVPDADVNPLQQRMIANDRLPEGLVNQEADLPPDVARILREDPFFAGLRNIAYDPMTNAIIGQADDGTWRVGEVIDANAPNAGERNMGLQRDMIAAVDRLNGRRDGVRRDLERGILQAAADEPGQGAIGLILDRQENLARDGRRQFLTTARRAIAGGNDDRALELIADRRRWVADNARAERRLLREIQDRLEARNIQRGRGNDPGPLDAELRGLIDDYARVRGGRLADEKLIQDIGALLDNPPSGASPDLGRRTPIRRSEGLRRRRGGSNAPAPVGAPAANAPAAPRTLQNWNNPLSPDAKARLADAIGVDLDEVIGRSLREGDFDNWRESVDRLGTAGRANLLQQYADALPVALDEESVALGRLAEALLQFREAGADDEARARRALREAATNYAAQAFRRLDMQRRRDYLAERNGSVASVAPEPTAPAAPAAPTPRVPTPRPPTDQVPQQVIDDLERRARWGNRARALGPGGVRGVRRALGYDPDRLDDNIIDAVRRQVARNGREQYRRNRERAREALQQGATAYESLDEMLRADLRRIDGEILDARKALARRAKAFDRNPNNQRAANDIASQEANLRRLARERAMQEIALRAIEDEGSNAIRDMMSPAGASARRQPNVRRRGAPRPNGDVGPAGMAAMPFPRRENKAGNLNIDRAAGLGEYREVVNPQIRNEADAVRWVAEGGDLSQVPHQYWFQAIKQNSSTDAVDMNKRFRRIAQNGGIIGDTNLFAVRDANGRATKQGWVLKAAPSAENVGELIGWNLQAAIGMNGGGAVIDGKNRNGREFVIIPFATIDVPDEAVINNPMGGDNFHRGKLDRYPEAFAGRLMALGVNFLLGVSDRHEQNGFGNIAEMPNGDRVPVIQAWDLGWALRAPSDTLTQYERNNYRMDRGLIAKIKANITNQDVGNIPPQRLTSAQRRQIQESTVAALRDMTARIRPTIAGGRDEFIRQAVMNTTVTGDSLRRMREQAGMIYDRIADKLGQLDRLADELEGLQVG